MSQSDRAETAGTRRTGAHETVDEHRITTIAQTVLAAAGARKQMAPITAGDPAFDLAAAYRVTAAVRRLREERGERVIGRKLGFTNRTIWDEYGVYAPIWGYVYDTTVRTIDPAGAMFDVSGVVEPRLEPEITLAFARAPKPGMDDRELLSCIAWVAHGFEVVQSVFPGWKFAASDTVAAFGLHGALMLGPRHEVKPEDHDRWLACLTTFEVELHCDGRRVDTGAARNVLDGPLAALRNCVAVLSRDPRNPPIAAGEIVTTGTITRAFPMRAGQMWQTRFAGAPFEGLNLQLV